MADFDNGLPPDDIILSDYLISATNIILDDNISENEISTINIISSNDDTKTEIESIHLIKDEVEEEKLVVSEISSIGVGKEEILEDSNPFEITSIDLRSDVAEEGENFEIKIVNKQTILVGTNWGNFI